MTKDIYTPFTYHIAWTSIDKHYYGVKYAKGCHPSDLWSTYFTSSKLVFDYRQKYGEPDVIEIRKTFDDPDSAIAWETKVLRRLNVLESDKWLNQCIGNKKWLFKEHTSESRAKISSAKKGENNPNYGKPSIMKGKSHSPETRAKQSASNKGKKRSLESRAKMSAANKGKKHSPETRAKMSAAKKGENNPNYGKPPHNKGKKHSLESRAKMSAAQKAIKLVEMDGIKPTT